MLELTDQERAAMLFHIIYNVDDWKRLYKIAKGEEQYNKFTPKSLPVAVSKWKNSERMQQAEELVRLEAFRKRQEIEDAAKEEARKQDREAKQNDEKGLFSKKVNFLDRDEFLQELNERANRLTDSKELNDVLKMLSDNMRYKEADKTQNNEIQRFYTPLLCKDCPLYQRESELIEQSKTK